MVTYCFYESLLSMVYGDKLSLFIEYIGYGILQSSYNGNLHNKQML